VRDLGIMNFNIGNFNMSVLLDARYGGIMASYSSRYAYRLYMVI